MGVRHVVGCMSGTSCDGIDAALVSVEGEGLAARARFIAGASVRLGELGDRLRELQAQQPRGIL